MKMIWWWNLSRSLEDFMNKAMKWENYRDGVLDTMEKFKDENFAKEWWTLQINPKRAPLSVATSKARIKRVWYYKQSPNRPWTLRWTWNLQENIQKIKSSLSCAMVFNANYAIYHQDGKGSKRRAVFEFSPQVKTEIMRTIQKQFNDEIGIRNARKSS